MRNPAAPPSFAALVQSFFAEHLTQQRALSERTVAAYRDAFMLFLEFAQARLHKPPTSMLLTDITPALILAFLDHLETDRHNAVRSRNARLAALREASEGFRVVDPWEAAISRWIEDRSPIDLQRPVTSQRIMVDVLGLRLSDTDQRAANRVAAVMKRLGWVNRPEWIDGRTQRVWNRKDATP